MVTDADISLSLGIISSNLFIILVEIQYENRALTAFPL